MSDIEKTERNWTKLMLAAPLIIMGGVLGFFGQSIANPFVIVIGFAMLAVGVIVAIKWWQTGTIRVDKEARKLEATANSLNIYPDHVEFAYTEKPLGWPMKCLNDNKYYHVHVEGKDKGGMKPFSLPDDEAVDDPQEFANPVTMPCNKKYFSWFKPGFQKVSMIIIGVVILFELITLIALGG